MSRADLTPTPVRETPYLTVIADRHPRQKAHSTRGHAHSALSQRARYRRGGYRLVADVALYQWHDDDWRLLWQGAEGDPIDRATPPWKEASL